LQIKVKHTNKNKPNNR